MTQNPPILERSYPAARHENLTDREKECIAYLHKHCKPFVCYELNLAHDLQWAYAVENLKRSGETPENAPQTFRALELARKIALKEKKAGPPTRAAAYQEDIEHLTVEPYNAINQFNQQPQQNPNTLSYHATAISTTPAGTEKTSITLNLVDLKQEEIQALTTQTTTSYLEGTNFHVSLDLDTPQTEVPEIAGNATFYVYKKTTPIPTVYFMSALDTVNASAGCLTAPTYKEYQGTDTCTNQINPNTAPVVACWYRGGDDCDYYNPNGNPTDFEFPVVGDMTYPSEVYKDPNSGDPVGVFILYLQPTSGGAAILANQSQTDANQLQGFIVDGSKVSWDFPKSAFPNDGSLNKGGANCQFNLFLSVALNNGGTGNGTFSSDTTLRGLDGVFIVPGMYIKYGCLAAGTEIKLADGKLQRIETFVGDGRESVASDLKGDTRKVIGVTPGVEPLPMIVLKDDKGHEVMMTDDHPVMMAGREVKLAKYLEVGDTVLTDMGEAELIEVGRRKYEGEVWNLQLGDLEAAERKETTMYANGFLVGDSEMQAVFGEKDKIIRRNNPLQELPREWHEDYLHFAAG